LTVSVAGCLLDVSNIFSNTDDSDEAEGAVVTAAMSLGQHRDDRAEQVERLRRKMAAISGKVGPGRRGQVPSNDVLPEPESLLPSSAEPLPTTLPKGTVAVLSGARSLSLSMVAAVTAAGGHAAIVGQPDVGLLAAVEMGADLSRLAVIPQPGADPVEVAAVLMDGMDLVVLDLGGRSVPATRARAVVARARQRGCTLLVTGGEWQGASARLEARVSGYDVTGGSDGRPVAGCGRISRVRLAMRARGRTFRSVHAVGE
jgi:hypothetical protein